jgi:DNA-binding response OmpR family regulator
MEPRPRVLIVEDEPGVRQLLRATLGRDFDVDEADNGEVALRQVAALRYDVILLDVVLAADQSGYTICDAIRRLPSGQDVKIVFCTAIGGVAGRSRGIEAGADACVTKPFSPSALLAQLRGLLPETFPPASADPPRAENAG